MPKVRVKGQGKLNMHYHVLKCAAADGYVIKISPCLSKLELAKVYERQLVYV